MVDFKTFQAQAVDGIKERCDPNWAPPTDPNDPKRKELPFNLSQSDWKWFTRNVPLDAPHLGKLTTLQLRELFPKPKSRTLIIRTFIWQCWLWIQMGEIPSIHSNIRGLWYQRLEGFMRRHGLVRDEVVTRAVGDSDEDRIIETMSEQVALFVEHRIFRYSGAFEFIPSLNAIYKIGQKKRGWMFFTEKVGLWDPMCLDLWNHDTLSNTVMASEGEPSAVALEKLGMELRRLGVASIILFTFADYDPWGWWIDVSIDSFMRQLGFEVQTWRLVTPELFTEETANESKDFTAIIEKFQQQEAHPDPNFSPTSKETLVYNWFKLSGGWNGRALAMHCDTIPADVREARIQKFIKELQKKKPNFPGMLVGSDEPKRLMDKPAFYGMESLQRMFRY